MDLGKNIFNAFEVVNKTHENVSKLMDYCKTMCSEKGEYVLVTSRFLRWKSDSNYWGWNLRTVILLFQSAEDKKVNDVWRDGPVYGMEINLYEKEVFDEPMVTLAMYDFDNIASWTGICSPADHYIFYEPLYDLAYEKHNDIYYTEVKESYGKKYWNLKSVKCIMVPLVDIRQENAYEKIFGSFNKLKNDTV